MLLYRHPGPVGEFVEHLFDELRLLPLNLHKLYILGDLSIYRRMSENPLVRVIRELNLIQLSSFSTHSSGGILDIILANNSAVMGLYPFIIQIILCCCWNFNVDAPFSIPIPYSYANARDCVQIIIYYY